MNAQHHLTQLGIVEMSRDRLYPFGDVLHLSYYQIRRESHWVGVQKRLNYFLTFIYEGDVDEWLRWRLRSITLDL